jgi:hypothetical protein
MTLHQEPYMSLTNPNLGSVAELPSLLGGVASLRRDLSVTLPRWLGYAPPGPTDDHFDQNERAKLIARR